MEPRECQQVSRGTSDATTLSSLIDCCCGYCSFGVSPPLTSTAGVHQMRPFCRHSFIIIIIIDVVVVIVVSHLKSFQPQNSRFPSFKNNTGRTDGRTDGPKDRRMDGHDLLQRCMDASKNRDFSRSKIIRDLPTDRRMDGHTNRRTDMICYHI